MTRHVAALARVALLLLLPCSAPAQGIAITHDAVGCIQANRFPQFFARFDPKDAVSRARLHFRPTGWPHWYSVPMAPEGAGFVGVLPKPDKSLTNLEYYISVTDRSFGESRSEEYAPIVVSGPAACEQKKLLATALARARSVVVSPPPGIAGLPKVPVGFSSDSVVAGASGTGGTVAGSAAAAGAGAVAAPGAAVVAAGGGGLGTGVIVAGAGVLAAGAAVAVTKASGGSGGGSGGPSDAAAAAAGTFKLELINGAAPPVVTIPKPPNSCVGFMDAGTLILRASGQASGQTYDISTDSHFECTGGSGPIFNGTRVTGQWSVQGGTVTFTGGGSYSLSTGTLSGSTLTLPLNAPHQETGNPANRVTTTWRKQ